MYHTGFPAGQALFRSARSSYQDERVICSVKILYVGDSVIDKGGDAGFWVLYFYHSHRESNRISPFRFDGGWSITSRRSQCRMRFLSTSLYGD
jgi:hypothetical protein